MLRYLSIVAINDLIGDLKQKATRRVNGLDLMCRPNDLIDAMLPLVVSTPSRRAQKDQALEVGEPD